MLLALAATWVLAQRGRPWLYVLLMAAAAYTHPLAVVLAPGHLAVVLLDRQKARPWIIAILIAPAIGAALYLPFLAGASQYWRMVNASTLTGSSWSRASSTFTWGNLPWDRARHRGDPDGTAGPRSLACGPAAGESSASAWRRPSSFCCRWWFPRRARPGPCYG